MKDTTLMGRMAEALELCLTEFNGYDEFWRCPAYIAAQGVLREYNDGLTRYTITPAGAAMLERSK